MASLLLRQRVLLAKIETTSGTAEALTASEGVFNVYTDGDGPIITDDTPTIERPGQSAFSRLQSIPGARSGSARFFIYLHGLGASGAIPAWASTFLPPCGMVATGASYSFVTGSTTAKTITIGEYIDGVCVSLAGCVGNWTMNYVNGIPVRVDFEFTGIIEADADVALPTPSYPTVLPPRWANSSGCSFGSYTPLVSTATVSSGNVLKLREDANKTSGYLCGLITDRVPTWTLDPEAEVVATKNWQSEFRASTQASLAFVVGTSANNIITTTLPKAQVTAAPNFASREGLAVRSLSGIAGRSASAGDDEVTVAFT